MPVPSNLKCSLVDMKSHSSPLQQHLHCLPLLTIPSDQIAVHHNHNTRSERQAPSAATTHPRQRHRRQSARHRTYRNPCDQPRTIITLSSPPMALSFGEPYVAIIWQMTREHFRGIREYRGGKDWSNILVPAVVIPKTARCVRGSVHPRSTRHQIIRLQDALSGPSKSGSSFPHASQQENSKPSVNLSTKSS